MIDILAEPEQGYQVRLFKLGAGQENPSIEQELYTYYLRETYGTVIGEPVWTGPDFVDQYWCQKRWVYPGDEGTTWSEWHGSGRIYRVDFNHWMAQVAADEQPAQRPNRTFYDVVYWTWEEVHSAFMERLHDNVVRAEQGLHRAVKIGNAASKLLPPP